MRRNLGVLFFVCVTALAVNWVLYQKPDFASRKSVSPDIILKTLGGTDVALKDIAFTGDMVIHFWATWCPPCIAELPELLQRAARETNVPFVIISVDNDPAKAEAFLKPYASYTHDKKHIYMIHDARASVTQSAFGVNTFPETVIVNRDFSVRKHVRGVVNWSSISLKH